MVSPALKLAGGAAMVAFGAGATELPAIPVLLFLLLLLGVQIGYGVRVWYRQEL